MLGLCNTTFTIFLNITKELKIFWGEKLFLNYILFWPCSWPLRIWVVCANLLWWKKIHWSVMDRGSELWVPLLFIFLIRYNENLWWTTHTTGSCAKANYKPAYWHLPYRQKDKFTEGAKWNFRVSIRLCPQRQRDPNAGQYHDLAFPSFVFNQMSPCKVALVCCVFVVDMNIVLCPTDHTCA